LTVTGLADRHWACDQIDVGLKAASGYRFPREVIAVAVHTYVEVSGRWTYLYRAVDPHGQLIDVLITERRDARAARTLFTRALSTRTMPAEVTTDLGTGPPGSDRGVRTSGAARVRAVRDG
jgi:transposase-like protein